MSKKAIATVVILAVLIVGGGVILQRTASESRFMKRIDKGIHEKEKGHFNLAKKLFKEAVAMRPDSADAHFLLGTVYLSEKKAKPALKEFHRAIDLNPRKAEYYSYASFVHFNLLDDREKAVSLMKQALKLEPDNYQNRVTQGVYMEKLGRNGEAIEEFERAIELAPSLTGIKEKLIVLYETEGEAEKANRLKEDLKDSDSGEKNNEPIQPPQGTY